MDSVCLQYVNYGKCITHIFTLFVCVFFNATLQCRGSQGHTAAERQSSLCAVAEPIAVFDIIVVMPMPRIGYSLFFVISRPYTNVY